MSELERLEEVIRSQGLGDNGESPHSWRCEHPDIYPFYCECVAEMRDAILNAGFRFIGEGV